MNGAVASRDRVSSTARVGKTRRRNQASIGRVGVVVIQTNLVGDMGVKFKKNRVGGAPRLPHKARDPSLCKRV